MRRLIPGTFNVFISDTFEITYLDGEKCNFPIDDEGKVEIILYGHKQNLPTQFLMLYAWFEMPPFINLNDIYFMSLNTPRKVFPWRARLRRPYCHDSTNMFRLIPSFPTMTVSSLGECYNLISDRIMPQYIGKTGYSYVNIYDPLIMKWRHVGVHQLVAAAWVEENQDTNNRIINHIDGVRHNNLATNLEWCTLKHNNIDGILRSKNNSEVIGKVRDIESGEVHEFKTIKDMASFMGTSHHMTSDFKGSKVNRLYNGKYEVRLAGDQRPWFYTTDRIQGGEKSMYVINVIEPDGLELIFNGPRSFRDHYGFCLSKKSVEDAIATFKTKFPEYQVHYSRSRPEKGIEVCDIASGKVTVYPNRTVARKATNMTWDNFNRSVTSDGARSFNGFKARAKSENPWPEEAKVSNRNRPLKVTNNITNEVSLYTNIKSAASDIGMDRHLISRHIVNPHPNDLYSIEFLKNTHSPSE